MVGVVIELSAGFIGSFLGEVFVGIRRVRVELVVMSSIRTVGKLGVRNVSLG